MSQAFHRGEYPDDWGAIAMTPTDLLAIMRESGLPKWTWGCEPSGAEGLWLSYAGTLLQIDEAAALCEARLRRAIREAVGGSRPVILATAQGDHNWRAWITTTSPDGGEVIHGDVYGESELHALARLHAAVKEKA